MFLFQKKYLFDCFLFKCFRIFLKHSNFLAKKPLYFSESLNKDITKIIKKIQEAKNGWS